MAEEYMLTTIDNKWNPFTNFREWFEEDRRLGYNTLGILASFSLSDYENSENDQKETNKAIDTICKDPFLGSIFRKVTRESFEVGENSKEEDVEAKKEKKPQNEPKTLEKDPSDG